MINEILEILPITILVGLIYLIIRIKNLKKQKINYYKETVYFLFVCYITALVNLVLVPNNFWYNIWSLIKTGMLADQIGPFLTFNYKLESTILLILKGEYVSSAWVKFMIVGNIILFIPLGMFINLIKEKISNIKIIILSIIIPICVETFQLLIGRTFDVDDLVTNTLGILIGYYITKLIKIIILKIKKTI